MQTALVPLVERAAKVWKGAADCWWGALKIKTVEEAEASLGGDCVFGRGNLGRGSLSCLLGFGELSRKPVFQSSRFLNLIQGEAGRQFLEGWAGAQDQGTWGL